MQRDALFSGHPFLLQQWGNVLFHKGVSSVSGNKKESYSFSCVALVKVILWPNQSYYRSNSIAP